MVRGSRCFDHCRANRERTLWLGRGGVSPATGPEAAQPSSGAALAEPGQGSPRQARAFLARPPSRNVGCDIEGQLGGTMSRFDLDGRAGVLWLLACPQQSAASLENQLVPLTWVTRPLPSRRPELRITSCNPATAKASGHAAADLVGQPSRVVLRPRRGDKHPQPSGGRSPDAYSQRATVVRRRDGTLVPVRVEAVLLADDSTSLSASCSCCERR